MSPLHETHASDLHEHIVDVLGARVVTGVYPPGTRLLSEDLADDFGSSRSAIREAVRVLESLGLVTVRRRVGIETTTPDHWNSYAPSIIRWRLSGPDRISFLHSLSQLRAAIEPMAARLAAEAASTEQRVRISQAALRMKELQHEADEEPYLLADSEFHTVILEASHNPMLSGLAGVATEVLRGRTQHALMPSTANPEAIRLHQVVAAAIFAGDADAAHAGMSTIVDEADQAMQRTVVDAAATSS